MSVTNPISGPSPAELSAALPRIALAAGAAIMEVYGRDEIAVDAKSDQSPVTEADLAADRLIREGLQASFPDIPAVTEEAAESHAIAVPDLYFLVDPLDGTKEFVQRRGEFTVNIALIERGVPIAGVVYAPARGRLFMATGDGAVEHGVEDGALGPARAIAMSEPDNAALRVVASKSHRDQATDDYIARFRVGEFKSAGSSLKFCLLAAGEADFYPRLGRTMEWDTAAGHAVVAAAGGEVLRLDDQTPLRYGKPNWENPHFLVRAPGVELCRQQS